MPMTGKLRGPKRSSGTSYSSTVTIITFIAVCGLGLWLLTSNSFTPPQTITRTATTTPMRPIARPHNPKPFKQHENTAHEDVPGEFPEDIIKSVNPTTPEIPETQTDQKDSNGGGSFNEKDVPKIDNDVKIEATTSNDQILGAEKNMENMPGKESVKEQEKQAALQNQATEESSVTQKQEVKQIPVQPQKSESKPVEKPVQDPLQNHISEEDQRQRVQEHQHQEDVQVQKGKEESKAKQDPHGAISGDQIQHDDAQIHPAPPETLSQKIGETKLSEQTVAIPKESTESKKSWSTQAHQSENEKERRYTWQLCNVTAGADYIPCLDNEKAIAKIHKREHYQHRERHCPEEPPTCLVPLPNGYKRSMEWPQSRDKIWYYNVPHTLLAEVKGHQNWVKKTGEFLTFPGGGTQFIHGALHYIDFIQQAVPEIAWGKHTRVVLDVGCGVASFGGFLFERNVLAMSFAPKDEHEAQVQFALERGIPAISAVMGSQRLQFPSRVFDLVHCARCRVPWHADGGALLLELNRVLRPGGHFVWSATPVYQKEEEDVEIWKEMSHLTVAMCWELVTIKKDKLNSVGAAIYHKPDSNDCYEQRKKNNPPMCKNEDDSSAAWYVPLQSCMHRVPTEETARGSQWPDEWPKRVETPPYWLNKSQMGIYGKPAPEDFASDYEHWKKVVSKSYMSDLGINWSNVRNVMDMRAVYGGFAAALKDLKVWVMNVVNVDSPDTLPIIYERGLFGIYHDWCESFSTYPRTYDLLHADHLFSKLKSRCKLVAVMAEVDRMARPGGKLIVRDESSVIKEVENLLKSLHWEVHLTFSKNQDGILSAQKSDWRPDTFAAPL